MTIAEKNYESLKTHYPAIYARLMALPKESDYQIINSAVRGAAPNLRNKKTGLLFYDEINPYVGAEKDVVARNIKVTGFNIFLGAGLMYQVFAFFKKYKVEGGGHIVIERNPAVFAAAMQTIDMSQMFGNKLLRFIVGEDIKGVFAEINSVLQRTDAKFYVKAVNIIEHPVSFSEDKEYYMHCMGALKEAVKEALMFYGNDPKDSMIGIENTFLNIEEIIENPGIKDLKDAFKGKPGVVIATGPSLNKNVELLRGIGNKAVLVGADASLRVLRKRGLKPHMVASLERLIPTAKLFENMSPEDFEDVYYSATPVIHPQTYANYLGKRIIVYRNFATFKWLDIERGILDIGPSSGNMAFKLLEYMGCDPIILIGQDLAYGEEGNTHATGSTYGEKEKGQHFDESNTVMVEGNYAPKVKTTKVWNTFLNFYHKDAMNSPAKVINATEGGAKIFNTEIMTFQEAIDKYINDDIDTLKVIGEKLNMPTDDEKKACRISVLEKVKEGIDISLKAIQVFDESYRLCDEFFDQIWADFKAGKPYDEKRAEIIMRKVDDNCLIFRDPIFFNVIMHYVQSYFIRCMIEINAVRNERIPVHEGHFKIMDILKDMFAVMIHLIRKMEYLLKQLERRLEADLAN